MSELGAVIGALRADPGTTALLLDFDGTLAPIVDDPGAAAPLPGTAAVLEALHAAYGLVAVISGRPVAYLQDRLPACVTLVGLYGLERVEDGAVAPVPGAEQWRAVIDEVAAAATEELPEQVVVEHKGLSLTLHVRQRSDLAEVVFRWAESASERSRLQVRRARMSAELHPPIATDKGTVVDGLLEGLGTACFIGDDVGDLPAFDALDRFAVRGGTAKRIVVQSTETDPTLLARADAVVAGPDAVLALLHELVIA